MDRGELSLSQVQTPCEQSHDSKLSLIAEVAVRDSHDIYIKDFLVGGAMGVTLSLP